MAGIREPAREQGEVAPRRSVAAGRFQGVHAGYDVPLRPAIGNYAGNHVDRPDPDALQPVAGPMSPESDLQSRLARFVFSGVGPSPSLWPVATKV